MKVYQKGTGEKYMPFDHFGMSTQVLFNPDLGSPKANITLSTLPKNGGSHDEVHEASDQYFYIVKGSLKMSAHGKLLYTLREGDAIMVEAGDVHAVINENDEDCVFVAITVPPLAQTH